MWVYNLIKIESSGRITHIYLNPVVLGGGAGMLTSTVSSVREELCPSERLEH